ncbi:MAG: MotA/TolQ/ExbB proton channel family protein [Gammaproteobacteria bacterium]|nr:MotA/TolQ/ExbB proton channel family protein [Gammaproteobacteria bacterium]
MSKVLSSYLPGYEGINELLYSGGVVLPYILLTSIVLWLLICERIWTLYFAYSSVLQPLTVRWQAVACYEAPRRKKIRAQLESEARVSLSATLSFISTLVTVSPLLGLLGTTIGMVEIFDVVAVSGSGNVRAMAAGVGQCTLSTMAGLVVALPGLYWVHLLTKRIERLMDDFSREMAID